MFRARKEWLKASNRGGGISREGPDLYTLAPADGEEKGKNGNGESPEWPTEKKNALKNPGKGTAYGRFPSRIQVGGWPCPKRDLTKERGPVRKP